MPRRNNPLQRLTRLFSNIYNDLLSYNNDELFNDHIDLLNQWSVDFNRERNIRNRPSAFDSYYQRLRNIQDDISEIARENHLRRRVVRRRRRQRAQVMNIEPDYSAHYLDP